MSEEPSDRRDPASPDPATRPDGDRTAEPDGAADAGAADADGVDGSADTAAGPDAGSDPARSDRAESDRSGSGGEARARDVVVPMALYKRVTTYATLTAVAAVVVGFVLLDAATLQVSLTRRFVVGLLGAVGVVPAETLLTALFSVLGLGAIAFGAGVYVLGTRFRAEGMGPGASAENGNPQDDDPEV